MENLDFFGTNDGLVLREDSPPANSDEDQSSDDSDSDAGEPDDSRVSLPSMQSRYTGAWTLFLEVLWTADDAQ